MKQSIRQTRSIPYYSIHNTHLTMWLCCRLTFSSPVTESHILAEKSAAPDDANVASLFNATLHTAPLWPMKVPTQSPVSPARNMGLPSKMGERISNNKHIWDRDHVSDSSHLPLLGEIVTDQNNNYKKKNKWETSRTLSQRARDVINRSSTHKHACYSFSRASRERKSKRMLRIS